MRHLTCLLQEVPQDLPSLCDKLQDARVKRYKRGCRGLTSNLQPPLPTHTGCYVSMLMSSPGLCAPINSRPYGFQLWLLADVCPTHRSIWHTRDLVSPFGSFEDFCQILIISLHQVDWCFPRGEITPQCGCYLYMNVISVTCSASSHSWELLPCFTCKLCTQIGWKLWIIFIFTD